MGELEARARELPKDQRQGTFNLIEGCGIRTRDFGGIDVGALQMETENHGAFFQAASNFNCLEFISSRDSARRGITKYVSDHTQGPAASISCAPATLYRNYFVPMRGPNGEELRGQLDVQIELLDEIPLIPVYNGYVKYTPDTLERLHREGKSFDWKDVSRVKVGVHSNCQVTSGLKANYIELNVDRPEQRVSQIFSAAMDLGGWGNPADDPLVVAGANLLLLASYRAAIVGARLNKAKTGNPKCYLTLMGGGVFHNKPSWIVDAIMASKKELLESGCDFYLVLFNGGYHELGERSYSRLKKLVKTTGGTIKSID